MDLTPILRIFLKIGNVYSIAFISICGAIFHKHKMYLIPAALVCFVMIFNTLLKDFFKVPLFPHLGEGYAFPSGHMHAATIFYGYFLYKIKNPKIKILIAILLSIIGFSLIQCHYHDWFDVLGAVAFSTIELSLCNMLSKKLGDNELIKYIFGVTVISFITLHVTYSTPPHTWLALYTSIGIVIFFFFGLKHKLTIIQKIIALIISILSIWIINYIFKSLHCFEGPEYIKTLNFLFFPLAIMEAEYIANILHNK